MAERAKRTRQPWGPAHQREGCAMTHEIVARMVREKGVTGAPEGGATCPGEHDLRWWLKNVAEFNVAQIESMVWLVRDIAEGRKVRAQSERWEVAFRDAAQHETFDSDTSKRNRSAAHRRASQYAGSQVIHVVTKTTRFRRTP